MKRKSESLPSPREKIKLISRVGVSSEVRKFSSNIEIAEKDLADLTKNIRIQIKPSSSIKTQRKKKKRNPNIQMQTF